ncbi:16S rRNA (guanine(966)-N(2))-methyltransferase RsmD [Ignavibacteria bacterium]|nr:16S rRNA (guanine(966)-N(2))-methyltransferase RsmD [Bacteroidota bacterium]MCZ2131900.1 16S rRNA (guanine(966)-N(2))-methyltransferase RsmD [Bacteroidota bacterium]
MRIIAGMWKGRTILSPKSSATRPTTDRLREAIFSALSHQIDLDGANIADICAGTGALGFEALSRGAKHCYFVERNRIMTEVMCKVAVALNAEPDSFDIICGDAIRYTAAFPSDATACDIVFFDPPYAELLCNKFVRCLHTSNILKAGGLLVAEHDVKEVVMPPADWRRIAQKSVGSTIVDILQKPL